MMTKKIEGFATNFVTFGNGVVVVNTTPHTINMQDMDGTLVEVPPCGQLINGTAVEETVDDLYVTTKFVGNPEGKETIRDIEGTAMTYFPDNRLVIIGSIIAAQAYPGKVAGMTPVPGFERVAPAEKRMRCDKFTIF